MSNNTSQQSKNSSNKSGANSSVEAKKSSMFNLAKNLRRPDVFTTEPRPGGYMLALLSDIEVQQEEINTALGIDYTPPAPSPRAKLIKGFHNLDNWVASKDPCDRGKDRPFDPHASLLDSTLDDEDLAGGFMTSPQDLNYVMAIAISTAMTLAANPSAKPPSHHLMWTMHFLNSIKDENNRTPMNLAAVKKLIMPYVSDLPREDRAVLTPDIFMDDMESSPSSSRSTASPRKDPTKPLSPQKVGPTAPPPKATPKARSPSKQPTPTPTPSSSAQNNLKSKGALPKKETSRDSGNRKSNWK